MATTAPDDGMIKIIKQINVDNTQAYDLGAKYNINSEEITETYLRKDTTIPASILPSYVDDVIEGYYLSDKFYKTNSTSGTLINGETGKIYVDREKQLEFLTVGDYGKENNIKADFLGLHKEINGVKHHEVDLTDKWVATISTQKGCPMKCKFCDCPKYGFHGNTTIEELVYEIKTILEHEDVDHTDRFYLLLFKKK